MRALTISLGSARRDSRSRQTAFTVIELMTVLIVIGVVITLVAPSMRSMMARQRVQGVQDGLITDLQLARSEMAQRSGASTKVAISFGGNADLSCYTIHVDDVGCDCTRVPGSVCAPDATREIKTVQFARTASVSVAASSPSGSSIVFSPPQGLASPTDLVIDVQDATSGQLRTTISGLGVPSVCSPDSSMRGVNPC
jgi:Tfp pilus assembly protein FimT